MSLPIKSKRNMMVRFSLIAVACVFAVNGNSSVAQPLERVDCSTLTGKVMCGYQGWFNCENDGMNLGWTHWVHDRREPFAPGNASVDLWPDVSELDDNERYSTSFQLSDGRAAEVFSSANRKTVVRHFEWMQDYGIDGAFVQRFANGLHIPDTLRHKDAVLSTPTSVVR